METENPSIDCQAQTNNITGIWKSLITWSKGSKTKSLS